MAQNGRHWRVQSYGNTRGKLILVIQRSTYSYIFMSFQVIDRKKDLVKLQNGEYVALGKVELALKECALVDNVCVHADPSKTFPVALVMANRNQLQNFANKSRICIQYYQSIYIYHLHLFLLRIQTELREVLRIFALIRWLRIGS